MSAAIILKILFVEDLEADQILAEREISRGGINFISQRVETEIDFIAKLEEFKPDLIISDYSMPSFDGMTALSIALNYESKIPFIILTGSMNEDTAVECIKAGADDYIIKENLSRLVPAINSTLSKYENLQAIERAEKLLKESEERFKTLFKDNQAVMLLINPKNHKIMDVNFAAENFYGWSHEKLTKMKLDEISTYSHDRLKEVIESAIIQKTVRYELKHRLSEGNVCDVEVFTSKIEFGSNLYLCLIVHDISERKKVEDALKMSDRVFMHSIDMLSVASFDGYFKLLNPSWERILGWSNEELLSQPWINFVHPEDRIATENVKSVIISGQEIYQFENRYICKDDTVKWLSWNTIPYPQENIIFGVVRDVTNQKKGEELLRTLSRAIEQSPISIIITDPDGKIEYINPKVTDVTGYKLEELKGQTPRVFKSGIQTEEIYDDLWKTIISGNQWQNELLNRKKNGDLFWENVIIFPIVNKKGEIINFVSVKEDITEKKKMIAEIIDAKNIAVKSDKLKTEFLAQISHEIRTPLNAVVNFTNLIKETLTEDLNNELDIAFGSVQNASQRIIRTIDLILNVSELQLGTYTTTEKEIDLIKLLRKLVSEYSDFANVKGIKLQFEYNVDPVIINSDDYALNQTFSNLIDNAIKFTKKGFVKIKVCQTDKGFYYVEIEDSGVGISKDFLGELFTLFSQEEHGYTRKFDGTGLGMSLVKKYCDLLNATISVESKKHIGTKITVFL